MSSFRGWLIALCILVSVSAVCGDVIVMTDGSRIIGKVQRLEDGTLKLETAFAGTIEIAADKVKSVETEEAVNVQMTTGDKLVGKVAWKDEISKGVVQTELGGIPFSTGMIAAIWQDGEKSPDELKLELKLCQAQEAHLASLPKWVLSLQAGIRSMSGNNERLNFNGRVDLSRKTDKDLLSFYVWGDYAEENEKRSDAEVIAGTKYEYLLGKRAFVYGRTEFEYDEFENIDLRATLAAGGGYYWIKEDDHEYKTRIGAGYRHESFRDGSQVDEPILELGHDYRIDIADCARFVHALNYNPSLDDYSRYLLTADQAIVIPIAASEVWKLRLGAIYQYNSTPSAGVERLDQTYYANLVAEIK